MKTRYVAEYCDVLDRLGLAQAEMGVSMRTAHGYANGVCIPEPVARFLALTLSLYKRGRPLGRGGHGSGRRSAGFGGHGGGSGGHRGIISFGARGGGGVRPQAIHPRDRPQTFINHLGG